MGYSGNGKWKMKNGILIFDSIISINVAVVAGAEVEVCMFAGCCWNKKARSADAKRFKPSKMPSLHAVRARWLIWFAMCV